MALFIRYLYSKESEEIDHGCEWHLGEPIPKNLGRVVDFQADGDELNLFLNAMAASRGECGDIVYTKMGGFSKQEAASVEVLGTCARLQNPHKYMRSCQNWRSVADGSMPPPGLVHEDGRGVCDEDRGYRHKKFSTCVNWRAL